MAQAPTTAPFDLGEVIQQAAREKDIDVPRWIAALEDAMASAAKKQHRIKEPVRATLDPATGKFRAFKVKTVVEELLDPAAEWTLDEARDHDPDAAIGDEILIEVSTEGLGRIAAQSAKQVLYQRIREAEREKIYNEFIDQVGELVNGTVKRFERGDIIVDLGRTEAAVPRSEQARHERYSQGERIRTVIVDVHKEPKGPQVILSRTDPRLLVKLFEMEVPEIYDGTVQIQAAVRAPGERAKVAVVSRERDVDPVGACVGMKGSRVQAIIRELRGEKIDIIEWSDDLVTLAQSALAPARITRVSITHQDERPHLDVIVEDEQLSLAIGKRGQNVRLASELLGARIDIKSETDVRGEVADALAQMLSDAMGDTAPAEETPVEIDLSAAPGLDEGVLAALGEAGLANSAALEAATVEQLSAIDGLDEASARSFLEWAAEAVAAERSAQASAALIAGLSLPDTRSAPAMGDQDFMAALSRALEESEEQDARLAPAEAGAEADGATTTASGAGEETGSDEKPEEATGTAATAAASDEEG